MLRTTLLLTTASLTAKLASASCSGFYFSVMSLRSTTAIHFAGMGAADSGIYLGLSDPGATCDDGYSGDAFAGYHYQDGNVYLYSTSGPVQQLYVDRSESGQGRVGYTTGTEALPAGAVQTGFEATLDYGDYYLTFDGADFQACPDADDDAWSVWVVEDGVTNPGGNTGCLTFSALVNKYNATDLIGCTYTQ